MSRGRKSNRKQRIKGNKGVKVKGIKGRKINGEAMEGQDELKYRHYLSFNKSFDGQCAFDFTLALVMRLKEILRRTFGTWN
jgi:hypothetical protein